MGVARIELHDWLRREPGWRITRSEKAQLDRLLPDLFGYHLLQVGHLAGLDLLAHSRVLYRSLVDIDDLDIPTTYPVVRARADCLPVESDSVDTVVLPHVLEFEDHPHDALREAFRVLVSEGHLILCGFNPWSALGAARWVLHRKKVAPWSGSFFGVNRVKDWLSVLGFEVLSLAPIYYLPPWPYPGLLRHNDLVDKIGRRTAPFLGGVYVLLARKRVRTLTPIRPSWRPHRRLVGVGLAGPTTRANHGD